MAWPVNARFQNFVSNTTRIAAAFLHAVQDAIIGVVGGTKSVASVDVDGVGDQAASAGAGNIRATGNMVAGGRVTADSYLKSFLAKSSATPGSGQAVAAGEIWKDTTCFAWGKVTVNVGGGVCTLARGANVASVTKTGVGVYTVALQTAATNLLSIQVTPLDSQASIMVVDKATAPTTTTFRVLCFDATGIASDTNGNDGGFYFEVKQG